MQTEQRNRVIQELGKTSGFIYVKGGKTTNRQWTDSENLFRQESNFYYLTGINTPDLHLLIDLTLNNNFLFLPEYLYSKDHQVWCGKYFDFKEIKNLYGLDCLLESELKSFVKDSLVYILEGTETDFKNIETTSLKRAITNARIFKSDHELAIMRKAAQITGNAHISLMKSVKNLSSELQLHALFEYECFRFGAQFQAYTPIVAAGKNAATLHYIKNNLEIADRNQFLLVDAGCELNCYASDVTRTYPMSGKFTGIHKTIYEIVLKCQLAVLEKLGPGIEYESLHRLAYREICIGLKNAGILVGSIEEMISNHIPALFFPHGLGHFLGLDVHDVGGYPEGVERIQEPGIRYLRMRRTLEPGMVVTIEPGVYFIDALLDPAVLDPTVNKFLNLEVLKEFRSIGGVRIEDDCVITEQGHENLTGWIPKTIQEIESVMA